jgi:predicted dehydrogenase
VSHLENDSPGIAIIGMGGYAGRHHEAVLHLEQEGRCRLIATCDPAAARFADRAATWRLAERGVSIHAAYPEMFARHAGALDLVVIPTPIPLHAEMHAAAVGAGLTVYLEKPPTLDPVELEEMIARDRTGRIPTLVGFNFIGEPVRQVLKGRLLAGEFGPLRSVRLLGLWGRSAAYYGRADWAGRLIGRDGRLILDSCLGNGLAHHVHNLLHWAGLAAGEDWASPVGVRCELRRAHAVEGPDTVFLAAETNTGVPLRLALSHACAGPEVHREKVVCDRAEIEYVTDHGAVIRWRNGVEEIVPLPPFHPQVENLLALLDCWRGRRGKPPTTLTDSRPFVQLHALAYISAQRITSWPEEEILREGEGIGPGFLQVAGLERRAEEFLATGNWPGETPREATLDQLGQLDAVVREMAGEPALCA